MRRISSSILLGLLSLLVGCHSPGGPEAVDHGEQAYPADFSLVFTVQPRRFVEADDPLRQPSHYVLEPGGTLRVALGPGVHPGLYPPVTAVLSSEEVARLYALVEAGQLMAWDDEPPAADDIVYRVELTAGSRTHRYATTPAASPATAALLRQLVALRGG